MNRRQALSSLSTAAVFAGLGVRPASGAEETDNENALGLQSFDHMSVNVIDFEKALTWYTDVLGLVVEVDWRVPALGGKQLAYLSLNGTRVLEIVAADSNGTGLRPADTFGQHFGRTGYGHLCFSTANVDQTMSRLKAKGVAAFVDAQTYPLDGTIFERRVAFINDPEGNVVEFGEPLREVR